MIASPLSNTLANANVSRQWSTSSVFVGIYLNSKIESSERKVKWLIILQAIELSL